MEQAPIMLDVEMTKKDPTYWDGQTEDGKRVVISYRLWRVKIEIDDKLIVMIPVPKDHPGTELTAMSNLGLKQAIMLYTPPGWFVLPF